MNDLERLICARIAAEGALSIATYMDMALQHPDYGYYRVRDPLGRQGDFVTAPEISQMFGEMIGLWCADAWQKMGAPSSFTLLEMGPGRGTLMQDALRATAKIKGFHDALHLALIESNQTLRVAQRAKLSGYDPIYYERIADLPPLPLVAISNEFFDALPIQQFEWTESGWTERVVDCRDNQLVFGHQPCQPTWGLYVPEDHDLAHGAVIEISPLSIQIMRDLARHSAQNHGAILTLDYGYNTRARQSTLQAVKHHAYADVLHDPGEVDLTAHVDFAALRRAAETQSVHVSSVVGQGDFLRHMGIELRAQQLRLRASPEQAIAIDQALHRLIDPAQMGTLFKVMAVSSSPETGTAGFV